MADLWLCPPDAFARTVIGKIVKDSVGRWGLETVTYDQGLDAVRTDYLSAPDAVAANHAAALLGWRPI